MLLVLTSIHLPNVQSRVVVQLRMLMLVEMGLTVQLEA